MSLTGELEQLHIADIIQLIHTTRKSGTFSVRGSRGESRIIFSNGYIVGANHLNNRVRIGTVLVKMNALGPDDLVQVLAVQKRAGKDRKPLLATLMQMGKLSQEQGFKGLKKLIEITVVELLGWTKGTFTFDTDAIAVSAHCNYLPGAMEQEMSLDAQMVLMDALRIFDERERDRQLGKEVQSYEEFYADALSAADDEEARKAGPAITAEDLGLADLDRLENKIPGTLSVVEVFDPAEIHRQKVAELMAEFPAGEREEFVSFLKRSMERVAPSDASARQDVRARALVFFSRDRFMKHAVMTVCKIENFLVFATDDDQEVFRVVDQCLSRKILPLLVFDSPGTSEAELPEEELIGLSQRVAEQYPDASLLQLAPARDYALTLQCYREGARAVLPRPLKKRGKETFVHDAMDFLDTLKSYARGFSPARHGLSGEERLKELRERTVILREIQEPSDVFLALLKSVSEMFPRCITFFVHRTGLVGERALGVDGDRDAGPTPAARLNIPLTRPSVFREAVEKGQAFYGQRNDGMLKEHLFDHIGAPLKSTILILPVVSNRKVLAVTYGDFGEKEESPVSVDMLEIMAHQAGTVLERSLCHKQLRKAAGSDGP